MKKGVVIFAVSAVGLALIVAFADRYSMPRPPEYRTKGTRASTRSTPAPEPDRVTLTADQRDGINELISGGSLKVDSSLNKAQIDLMLWLAMDADLKENTCAALAVYINEQKGSTTYWMEMFDKQSGRKLAKWSQTFGFEVF